MGAISDRPAGTALGDVWVAVGPLIPMLPVDPNPKPAAAGHGRLSGLVGSTSEKGIIEPLVVRPRGGRFPILAANGAVRPPSSFGPKELPAPIPDVDEAERLELALIEDLARRLG